MLCQAERPLFSVYDDVLHSPFSNPKCRLSPSRIVETKKGLVFTERDAHRWFFSMDFFENRIWPVLSGISSEMFALEALLRCMSSCLTLIRIYACLDTKLSRRQMRMVWICTIVSGVVFDTQPGSWRWCKITALEDFLMKDALLHIKIEKWLCYNWWAETKNSPLLNCY